MKRYAILLAALLLLALCAGCGRQAAEPETLADYMAALTADDVTDWNTEQYPDITLGRLVAAMNRGAPDPPGGGRGGRRQCRQAVVERLLHGCRRPQRHADL